jgi:hypothetical protein
MMHLTSVDLPAPFSPSSAWNEPAGTLIETLSSAVKEPKRMVMPSVSMPTALPAWGRGVSRTMLFMAAGSRR